MRRRLLRHDSALGEFVKAGVREEVDRPAFAFGVPLLERLDLAHGLEGTKRLAVVFNREHVHLRFCYA